MDLAASASKNQGMVKSADCIDTFRLFLDSLDFSYENSDGWIFLEMLLDARSLSAQGINAHADDNERNALAIWPLRMLAPDMKNNFIETSAALLLAWASNTDTMDVFDFLLKIFDNFIDARTQSDGYSILLNTLRYHYDSPNVDDFLNMMLTRGADPHLIGFEEDCSPQKETPTSLAMYSSRAFVPWRNALLRISTDLELFVQKELQQSPLKTAGWHEDSLLFLFQSHIHPQFNRGYYFPCDMCRKWNHPSVELPWWRWLDSIKEV